MRSKCCVVVGHHKWAKGAVSQYVGSEWDLMSKVAKGLECDTFIHNPDIRGYNSRQRAMAKRTAVYDIVFELHFNAAASEQANGCEALYWFSNQKGKKIAADFCKKVNKKLGIKNRGAKALHSKNQRGYGFLAYTKGTAIILEPFFGTNTSDCCKFDDEKYTNLLNDLISTL
jgi:N-acetylmuramoyl-L-alanine amidase